MAPGAGEELECFEWLTNTGLADVAKEPLHGLTSGPPRYPQTRPGNRHCVGPLYKALDIGIPAVPPALANRGRR